MPAGSIKRRDWSHQASILLYFWKSDAVFRLLSGAICFSLLATLSDLRHAAIYFSFVLASEVVICGLSRFYARRRFEITTPVFACIAALNIIVNLCYVVPAFGFYQLGSWPANFIGFMYLSAIVIYTASTYSGLPVFFFMNFIPGACALMGSTVLFSFLPDGRSGFPEWMIAMIGTILYTFNAFEIYRRQRETQRQLSAARREADGRLMELEHLSQYDQLTDLPNRSSFEGKLNAMLKRETRRTMNIAVALIDLNQFKPINDSFGHHAGDYVLIEVARRLRKFIQGSGHVARLGGDEFAMVLTDIPNRELAQQKGDQISDLLAMPILFEGQPVTVGASVGLALARDDGRDRSKLMKHADLAMYEAKRKGGGAAHVFDADQAPKRADLTEKPVFEFAIAQGNIRPYYQPKVDLLTGEILGLEALARWEMDDGKIGMPGYFIPKIEELGLMHDFTYAITRDVIKDINRWQEMGFDRIPVSINIDERMLSTPNGLQDLLWIVTEGKVPAGLLTFEVTEDVVLGRAGDFIRNAIQILSEQGVRISLDDFGTGFASFRHLEELHLDELKIDTSFVTKIGKKPTAQVIIEGFLGIAAGLDIEVVAEGVETEEQRDFLLKRGCKVGQGFLFSPAKSFIDVTKLLLSREKKTAG